MFRSLLILISVFSIDLNTQLEGQKTIVQQHRQPSVDNQNVPTAEESLCCNGFVALKSDFTELEKKVRQSFNAAQPQNRSDKRSHNKTIKSNMQSILKLVLGMKPK